MKDIHHITFKITILTLESEEILCIEWWAAQGAWLATTFVAPN